MAFPENLLKQTCVYWGNPQPTGYGGFTWDDPVELDCRWVGTTRMVTNNKGREVVSRASVQVAQDVDEDGMLYLGALEDLDSGQEDDPMTVDGAYPIVRFDKTPTARGGKFARIAYL